MKSFPSSGSEWLVEENAFRPSEQNLQEALFALSNGSLGVRGCLEEMPTGCMSGTYLGGVFDRNTSWTPDMVNLPSFLRLDCLSGKVRFAADTTECIGHRRALDMYRGVLYRESRLKARDGRILRRQSWRLVSLVYPALCAERHVLTPENFSGSLSAEACLDADVDNFDTFMREKVRHLDDIVFSHTDDTMTCKARLAESRWPVLVASRLVSDSATTWNAKQGKRGLSLTGRFTADPARSFVLDRFSTVAAGSRHETDPWRNGTDKLEKQAQRLLREAVAKGFEAIAREHAAAMAERWAMADFVLDGDPELQKKLRFNIFHLIQSGPRHSEHASIGARGLTGERYRGHIYWDTEMFMLPFYVFTDPASARNILMYRYRMLPGAKRYAASTGCRGARYPNQSADTGDEAAPAFYMGEGRSANRNLDAQYEIHVTAAIAYGCMLYVKATNDLAFMRRHGIDILVETARYWCSRMEWMSDRQAYGLLDVEGPDEYHKRVRNNAYTNAMARFNIAWALEAVRSVARPRTKIGAAIRRRLGLSPAELREWERKRTLLFQPSPGKDGVIEAFEGYFNLKPYQIGTLRHRDIMDIHFQWKPLPNGLGGTVKDPEQSQMVKQCDVILLLCLFPDLFPADTVRKNYAYYESRTVHTSSLSPNTAGIVGLRVGQTDQACDRLRYSASMDMDNIQRNGEHGIHMAAAGGTWLAAVAGFGGLRLDSRFEIEWRPVLPRKWKRIRYRFFWQGRAIQVQFDGKRLQATLLRGKPIRIRAQGRTRTLTAGR